MQEASKAVMRRLHDSRFATRYFVGHGIDIGCGDDWIGQHHDLFPLMSGCDMWDSAFGHGDAQLMEGVPDGTYDFIHASHVLEHVRDPEATVARWAKILKPGGHLIVLVPEWTMYEHREWPSTRNPDHKTAWVVNGLEIGDPNVPLRSAVTLLHPATWEILKIEKLDATFRPSLPAHVDQTQTTIGECAIEIIARTRA